MQLKFFMPVLMCLWVLQFTRIVHTYVHYVHEKFDACGYNFENLFNGSSELFERTLEKILNKDELNTGSNVSASDAVTDELGHELSLLKSNLTEILSDIENFKDHLKLSTHEKFNILARGSSKIVQSHASATRRQINHKAHEGRGKILPLHLSKQCVHHGDSMVVSAIRSAESELAKCKQTSMKKIEDYVRELDIAYNNGSLMMFEQDMVIPMCKAEDEHIEQEECIIQYLIELNKSIKEFESQVSSIKCDAEKEEQKVLSTLTRCNAEAVSIAKSRINHAEHSASSCLHD